MINSSNKNILYIHQYFKTPNEPGGNRSYWIAKKMIEKGFNVTILTSKNNLKSNIFKKNIDNITVIYLNIDYDQNMSVFRRLRSFINFSLQSLIQVFKLRNYYHKIYVTSTPLTVALPALFAYFILGKKFIFEVRDLWPEVPIQMGAIKNKFLIRLLKKIELITYQKAEKIIALSPGMYDGVVSLINSENKVYMIPNMSKPQDFYLREKNKSILNKYNFKDSYLNIIYFGSIGKANGLLKVVDYFYKLEHKKIHLYIAGDGSEKDNIMYACNKRKQSNISFIGNHKMSDLSEIINCCDLSLISFLNIPILKTNSPNKLFDSLSAGKPLIVNSSGWTKDLVENNLCGFYYEYENFESFSKMIDEILIDPDGLLIMGKNSRSLALNLFDKEILTEKIVKLL